MAMRAGILRRYLSTNSIFSTPSAASAASAAAGSATAPPKAPPSTSLFVSGLSKRTTTEGLREAFAKFGEVVHDWHLFDNVSNLDAVSATKIIGSLSRQHRHEEAIFLFYRMLWKNIRPNEFTFGTVIHSSTQLRDLNISKKLHACAVKMGLASNIYVGSVILDSYVKLSTIDEARKAFDDTDRPNVVSYTSLIGGYLKGKKLKDALWLFRRMPERNIVTWNAVISGCSQTGHSEEAVNLFVELFRDGLMPNESSFPSAIIAASNIAALGIGRSLHACAIKCLSRIEAFVGNSLISFYAKCGSMDESILVFNKLDETSIVSWNAVICGYGQNGRGKEAIEFFERMCRSGLKPNSVTFLGLLWACNHAGLVDEAYSYFSQAQLMDPSLLKPEHYACMVNSFSRSGNFLGAEKLLHQLSFEPGIGFWKALLTGCHIHSNSKLGEFASIKIKALDPDDVSSYVMLSNAHSAAGRWQNVSIIRQEMKEKGMKTVPGCSWIEIKDKVHVFVNRDWSHYQKDEIYYVLSLLIQPTGESEVTVFGEQHESESSAEKLFYCAHPIS